MNIHHIVPVADVVEHDTSGDDCVCGPRFEEVKAESVTMGWLVIHSSLDGREAQE